MVGVPPRHGGLQKQGPALNNARIVPDLVDHVDLDDAVTLSVRYGDRIVTTGNELKPSEAQQEPHVEIVGEGMFTLLMTDPDPPDPADPKWREFLHWMVVNIPNGEWGHRLEAVPHMGPAPPKGTHRYVFLLFRNPKNTPIEITTPAERKLFSTRKFAEQHGLGDPIRVEWFMSAPESKDA